MGIRTRDSRFYHSLLQKKNQGRFEIGAVRIEAPHSETVLSGIHIEKAVNTNHR